MYHSCGRPDCVHWNVESTHSKENKRSPRGSQTWLVMMEPTVSSCAKQTVTPEPALLVPSRARRPSRGRRTRTRSRRTRTRSRLISTAAENDTSPVRGEPCVVGTLSCTFFYVILGGVFVFLAIVLAVIMTIVKRSKTIFRNQNPDMVVSPLKI